MKRKPLRHHKYRMTPCTYQNWLPHLPREPLVASLRTHELQICYHLGSQRPTDLRLRSIPYHEYAPRSNVQMIIQRPVEDKASHVVNLSGENARRKSRRITKVPKVKSSRGNYNRSRHAFYGAERDRASMDMCFFKSQPRGPIETRVVA